MQVGDYVEWVIGSDDDGEPEAWGIGEVESVTENEVVVIEAHAFHRVWGGSSGERGKQVTLALSDVSPCRGGWRHVVRESIERYRKNPEKWDKHRAAVAKERETHGG